MEGREGKRCKLKCTSTSKVYLCTPTHVIFAGFSQGRNKNDAEVKTEIQNCRGAMDFCAQVLSCENVSGNYSGGLGIRSKFGGPEIAIQRGRCSV
jgi:hypothetical protein